MSLRLFYHPCYIRESEGSSGSSQHSALTGWCPFKGSSCQNSWKTRKARFPLDSQEVLTALVWTVSMVPSGVWFNLVSVEPKCYHWGHSILGVDLLALLFLLQYIIRLRLSLAFPRHGRCRESGRCLRDLRGARALGTSEAFVEAEGTFELSSLRVF